MPTELRDRLRAALAGRYAIERELGRGGMATVYLARDLRHERAVAVKVLHPEIAAALGPERFLSEIRVAANLQHPHLVPLLDSGEAGGFLYYVMPYVEGESLRARLNREHELPVPEVVRVLREVVDALAYAHGRGVVHRDIKPDNVMLSGRHALVTDFGVAKAISQATGRQKVTTAGVALGTPAYMAPEQATADPKVDHRVDIYAVGALAYELLTGRTPFTGPTAQAMLAAQLTDRPEPVTKHREAVPPALATVVMRCLEKQAADRWQSAEQLLIQLEALSTGAAAHRFRVSNRTLAAVIAAVLVLAAAGLWLVGGPGRGSAKATPKIPRLVVLPFDNLGPPSDEYFADGLTDEITSQLAGLSGLSVIAHTGAAQYKKTTKPFHQMVAELGVDYVLEGTVLWDKASGRVRVNPQLIHAADQTHMWAEPQEGAAAEMFKFQAMVAERVAQALDLKLAQRERQALVAVPTTNQEAYEYLLRGDAVFRLYDAREAAGMYEAAVARDSNFASAYARLSQAYSAMATFGGGEPSGSLAARAKAAAERALALQSELPEAHLALGYYYQLAGDLDRAFREVRLAHRERPNDPAVLSGLSYAFAQRGRLVEAAEVVGQALSLNPLSYEVIRAASVVFLTVGRYADARRLDDRMLALDPRSVEAYSTKTLTYANEGDAEAARHVMQEAIVRLGMARLIGEDPYSWFEVVQWLSTDNRRELSRLALTPDLARREVYYLAKAENYRLLGDRDHSRAYYDSATTAIRDRLGPSKGSIECVIAYARLGRTAEAIREGARAKEQVSASQELLRWIDVAVWLADVYLIVSDNDAGLRAIEEAWAVPGVAAQYRWKLLSDEVYAPLRSNPRFQRLLKRGDSEPGER
jgi:serine/threonine-protein kinase